MIGLNRPGHPNAQAAQDEPPAIRNLTKNQLYLLLSETYLLPSIESKGINRTYLVGVYTDQNYRLNLLEYKRFEAELTPSQQKKTNLVNLAYILRKLNALLVEENRRPLGFPDFIIPEEGWLTKVARYIDRKNVMEFFQASIDPMGVPLTVSDRVHHGRNAAYRFLFEGNALLDNQKVYHSVKDISESYRRIISRRIDLEDLEQQLNAMRARLHDEEAVLKSNIFKAATTIVAIAQQDNFNPDDLYMEGDDRALANRVQLQEVCRLLKYIYCTDSVLDRTQEVMDLTNNNFGRANQ
jgi:hypothetical protein